MSLSVKSRHYGTIAVCEHVCCFCFKLYSISFLLLLLYIINVVVVVVVVVLGNSLNVGLRAGYSISSCHPARQQPLDHPTAAAQGGDPLA